MSFTDPSSSIQAYVTDQARQLLARALIGQTYYQVQGFSVGRGGYDMLNPVHIIPINTSLTALIDPVYPDITGMATFQQVDQPTATSVIYSCRLPNTPAPSHADYGLGELGIWARILHSNIPAEVGLVFLFAVAHFPIQAKTNRDAWLYRVAIQY